LVVGQPLLFEALQETIKVAPTNNKKRSAVVFFILKGYVKRFVSVLYTSKILIWFQMRSFGVYRSVKYINEKFNFLV